jgi:hypothetical protein
MKHSIAAAFAICLCVMIFPSAAGAQSFQPSTDRRAPNDEAIALRGVLATAGNCTKACRDRSSCFAWTFVREVADGSPNCFVASTPREPRTDGCCVSGSVR